MSFERHILSRPFSTFNKIFSVSHYISSNSTFGVRIFQSGQELVDFIFHIENQKQMLLFSSNIAVLDKSHRPCLRPVESSVGICENSLSGLECLNRYDTGYELRHKVHPEVGSLNHT